MNTRTGSGLMSTALTVAVLVAAGVGGFAAFSKLTGGCSLCGLGTGAEVSTVSTEARPMPTCMTGEASKCSCHCSSSCGSKETSCHTGEDACHDECEGEDDMTEDTRIESEESAGGGASESSEG